VHSQRNICSIFQENEHLKGLKIAYRIKLAAMRKKGSTESVEQAVNLNIGFITLA